VLFWTEVAVIVTCNEAFVPGAVNSPAELMVPWLALQFTLVLKLPVPLMVAEHWLVCPEVMVEGEQLTDTPVTVELLLFPLPPQAANQITLPSSRKSPSLRTMSLLSPAAGAHRRSPGRLQRMSLAATPCGINCGM
jgi:hypothetical protein